MKKRTYGLIGYPLEHSFSAKYFTEKFDKENIYAEYLNFEIPDISLFPSIFKKHNIAGLNVTIPYKEQIIPYLDDIDPIARKIGAVNTIKIHEGKLTGFNTDYIGFRNSIKPLLKPIHKKALILGTGGASKGVLYGLNDLGIESKYVSRNKRENSFVYEDLNKDILEEYTIIVNTSPLGTYPKTDEAPDIPYHFLSTNHVLYDLVYNPAETKFLKLGKSFGSEIKNGAEMLVIQADSAWEIWNK